MQTLEQVLQWFLDLGSPVMLPIIFLLIGLFFRVRLGEAFKAALTIGVGFIGLNLVIGLLTSNLSPAAEAMVANFNLSMETVDVGWPAASAIAYGTFLGSLAIIIGIAVNVVLLIFGLTKTLNVDIWNFWHIAFSGSLVYAATEDFGLGIFTMVTYSLLVYYLGDKSAKYVQKYFELPNMSFPHGQSVAGYVVALPLNWLFDRIPGLNKIRLDPESVERRLGIFGDNTVVGFLIGVVIGILAGYDIGGILYLGVATGGVMLLLPRMVSLLMEGLSPISDAATEWVREKFPGRELYIGMDSALAVGHSTVLAASILLVPITLLLAVILPGNTTLPLGDLATIPFMISLMVPVFRGDLLRSVLGGTVMMAMALYISSWATPLITESAIAANFDLAGNSSVTVLSDGGIWTTLLFPGSAQTLGWIGIGILFIGVVALILIDNRRSTQDTLED